MCYGKATLFSWNGIPTHNPTHVPAVTGQAAEIVGDLAQLAGAATKAYFHAQSVKQAGLVDEAYLKARGQMLTWQQAGNALESQRDYEAQWNAIAQGIRNEYSGRLGDMYTSVCAISWWSVPRKRNIRLEQKSDGFTWYECAECG